MMEQRLHTTLREESSQTNVILQYKLLASILSAVSAVIQQSQYVLHFYYTLYDGKYDCKITMHQTIFQLQCFVLLNNHQYNCNITTSFLSVWLQGFHGYDTINFLSYVFLCILVLYVHNMLICEMHNFSIDQVCFEHTPDQVYIRLFLELQRTALKITTNKCWNFRELL